MAKHHKYIDSLSISQKLNNLSNYKQVKGRREAKLRYFTLQRKESDLGILALHYLMAFKHFLPKK